MQNTKVKLQALTQEYTSLLPIAENDQSRLWKKFRLEWNYNSNHIEGNTLTYSETELLLIFDRTKGNHTKRELDEMQAHDVAIEKVKEWAQSEEHPLTQSDIRELNEIILVKPFWKDAQTLSGEPTRKRIVPSEYKTLPNNVRLSNGEIFEYAAPEDVLPKMQELLDWYNGVGESDPIEVAALLHYRFVCIHPFDDGNGRVSRLLLNYHLLREGLPPIIIKSKDKAAYLRALNEADTGNVEAFIEYIHEQMIWSLELSIKAAQGEAVDESGDWKKKLDVLNKKLKDSNTDVVSYTSEIVLKRYFDSFLQLFKKIEAEVFFNINELFFDNKLFLEIGNVKMDKEYRFQSGAKMVGERLETGRVQEIKFGTDWAGFKKNNANAFNLSSTIVVKFHDYNYEIRHIQTGRNLITKTYSEPITEEDISLVKDELGNSIISFIEAHI